MPHAPPPHGPSTEPDGAAADGVTKFDLRFTAAAPPAAWQVAPLLRWRQACVRLGIVGQAADRYGGVGFGNLSVRHPGRADAFIVSGTQTGGLARLCAHHFAVVTRVDAEANRVCAHGGTAPSSEAMTHAQLYAADAAIGSVIHGHAPVLWRRAAELGVPCTPPDVAYGTPAMAAAVRALRRAHPGLPGLIAMGGHEDGIIAFGRDADDAGEWLVRHLRLAAG